PRHRRVDRARSIPPSRRPRRMPRWTGWASRDTRRVARQSTRVGRATPTGFRRPCTARGTRRRHTVLSFRSGHSGPTVRPVAAPSGPAARGTCARPRRSSRELELLAVSGGFRAVAAGGHVAPAPAAVFRIVEENVLAARVGAATHTLDLA